MKISEYLIKATLAAHIASVLDNSGEILGKIINEVLGKKRDSYSSTPTFLEELVRESLKPIAKEEWKKYLKEIEPDLRRMIRQTNEMKHKNKDAKIQSIRKGKNHEKKTILMQTKVRVKTKTRK